jgi:hypothetical protein
MSTTAPLDTAAVVAAVDDELTTAVLVLADMRIRRTVRRHEIERLRVVAERIGSAVKYLERKQNGR